MLSLSAAMPTDLAPSDEGLAQSIVKAVRATCVRPIAGLTIVADGGVVTLRGGARSFYEKQLLVHAARHVPGVRQIVDHVDVPPTKPR